MELLKQEREGTNELRLYKLSSPVKRFDGKKADYELTYLWYATCDSDGVLGAERSFWLKSEIDFRKGLFKQFNLVS